MFCYCSFTPNVSFCCSFTLKAFIFCSTSWLLLWSSHRNCNVFFISELSFIKRVPQNKSAAIFWRYCRDGAASTPAHLQLLSEVTKSWSLGRRWQSDGEEDYRLTSLLKQQQFVLLLPHKNARAVAGKSTRTEILIIPTLTLRFYWKRGMWVKRVGDISIVWLFYLNNSYSIQQCTDGKKRREEEDRKWAKWVKWYPPISSLIRFHCEKGI